MVRRPRVFLLLLLALAGGRLPAGAPGDFPGTDDKWQYFQSANFELYSRIRESSARELLHNLELLRSMFFDYLKLAEKRRLEVTIYAFRSQKDFQAYGRETYGPKHEFEGFYVPGIDRAVIYLVEGRDAAATRRLIFHEYVHHLFAAAEQHPPPWLNEGMAELFSTVAPMAGQLEFGHPVAGGIWELQQETLMPLERLFAVDQQSPIFRQGQHSGLFYAESWALLHYLHFGESKIDPERRRRFVGLVLKDAFRDAEHLRAGFKELLGMDYPAMEARLKTYVSSGNYFWGKHPMPLVAAADTYPRRAVPEAEIRLRLAELALRVSRSPHAKLMLLQAVERSPGDVRALEALGFEALRDDDEVRARERWGQAVELGTHNAAIYRELGLMEGRAVFSRFDVYYRMPEEKARRMREYLLRSIEYNPGQTAAYEMLAWVEAFAAEPSIKNINAIQSAYPGLARRERTALALAFVRVRLNQKEAALEMLAGLETMRPNEAELQAIAAIRAHLEGRPAASPARHSLEEAARVRTPPPKVTPLGPASDR